MYPTVYHALLDLFGWDIPVLKLLNSFGFFVAMGFIVGGRIIYSEFKRQEEEGLLKSEKQKIIIGKPVNWQDVVYNTLIGFILGWKFIYLFKNASVLFQPGSLPQEHIFSLEGYPLIGILSAVILGGYNWYVQNKEALPEPIEKVVDYHKYEYTGTLVMVAAISGIAGAKLFHLFENPTQFMEFFREPSIENFISGLTIYGGLIIGGIVTIWYMRKKGFPALHLIDAAAPALILSYGIGRVGCQVSGDGDWGIANAAPKPGWLNWAPDWMWSYSFPNNVNGIYGMTSHGYEGKRILESDPWPIFDGYGTYLYPGVFPTAFYETMMTLVIFGVLWSLRKKIKIPGMIFAIYLMFNGLERFFIEKIRVNNVFGFLGMQVTQAEVISTIFFLSGLGMAIWLYKTKKEAVLS